MELLTDKKLNEINGGFDGWDFGIGVCKVIGGVGGILIPEPGTTTAGSFAVASGMADIADAFDDE